MKGNRSGSFVDPRDMDVDDDPEDTRRVDEEILKTTKTEVVDYSRPLPAGGERGTSHSDLFRRVAELEAENERLRAEAAHAQLPQVAGYIQTIEKMTEGLAGLRKAAGYIGKFNETVELMQAVILDDEDIETITDRVERGDAEYSDQGNPASAKVLAALAARVPVVRKRWAEVLKDERVMVTVFDVRIDREVDVYPPAGGGK